MQNPDEALKLLRETQTLFQRGNRDLFEANTYLEPFVSELKDLFPGAVIVHLHRDGREVVRSVLERGWYGAPDERKHPALAGEEDMDQFSRACLYWARTNEHIAEHTDIRICYERMVSDRAYLEEVLAAVGIVVHPLLADEAFPKRLNASRTHDIPDQASWPRPVLDAYARICGPMHRRLGYTLDGKEDPAPAPQKRQQSEQSIKNVVNLVFAGADFDMRRPPAKRWEIENFRCEPSAEGLRLHSKDPDKAAHLVLHRGNWKKCREPQIAVEPGRYYRYHLEAIATAGLSRLFALSYDTNGALIEQGILGSILPDKGQLIGSLITPRGCVSLSLAVQTVKNARGVLLRSLRVDEVKLPERYLARDLLSPAP